MVDEVGANQLTLAALAARLGVRQPSLYKHVTGQGDLNRRVAIRAKAELADALGRSAIGRAGEDALIAIAHAYRAWAREHPGLYHAAQRPPEPGDLEDEAAGERVVLVVGAVMHGYDLEGDDAIDAIRVIRAALHGFVSLEETGSFALPVNLDRTFDRLIEALVVALARWSDLPDFTRDVRAP